MTGPALAYGPVMANPGRKMTQLAITSGGWSRRVRRHATHVPFRSEALTVAVVA